MVAHGACHGRCGHCNHAELFHPEVSDTLSGWRGRLGNAPGRTRIHCARLQALGLQAADRHKWLKDVRAHACARTWRVRRAHTPKQSHRALLRRHTSSLHSVLGTKCEFGGVGVAGSVVAILHSQASALFALKRMHIALTHTSQCSVQQVVLDYLVLRIIWY